MSQRAKDATFNAIFGYSGMLQEEAEDLDGDAFLPDSQRINGAGKHLLGC